ncbi:4'-phosphopantetheinyl transferase family protein [Methylocella silvestris]|uniref:4-phosphopantetheinyl transferase n=1 Tax=Methylocella silvestris TaxID=199596 RepID=A0A2J7TM26_METSI|nr:4'-phosphopantetheinyl transferase superfamily protein [Methylocella silvestris]PNG27829.1 4-phosphopantetheinyl transferase [Methylocella silvestris]
MTIAQWIRSGAARRAAISDPAAKLWLVEAAPDPERIATAESLLSFDEIARADRFYRLEDRARAVLSRAALRLIVGEAAGIAPEKLAFSLGPFGKPLLAARPDLHFNVSHSGELALIGLSAERIIGVDIELMRDNLDEAELARIFFCESEYRLIASKEGAARLEAFYRIWTAKEAVLKALGIGVAASLKDFEVRLSPGPAAIQPRAGSFSPALANVQIEPVAAPDSYVATVALA